MALLLSLKRTVDLEPGLTTPQVFHVSQNDVGTKLYVALEQGGTAYTIPDGTTAKVQGCNALGEPFEAITATVSTNEVYFTITDQDVTQFAGNAKCEVVLTNGTNILGTANFVVAVEASPMGSDVPAIYTNPVQAYIEGVVQDYVDDDILPDITAAINNKVDSAQGSENAGKVLVVNPSGNVEPVDALVTIDSTLTVQGEAADAKATGDALALKANESTIAPEFSDQSTYTVGQMVLKNGVLYRFTADHAASAWTGTDAVVVTVGGEVEEVKSVVGANEFSGQTVTPVTNWISKSNTAVTNNNDGTYTIGTSDYGNIFFNKVTLKPGAYALYGVQQGFSFLSTTETSTTAFVTNESSNEKIVAITNETECYIGYRNTSRPASSFTIEPYLKASATVDIKEEILDIKQSYLQSINLLGSFHNLVNYGYSSEGIASREGVSVKRYLNTIFLNNLQTANYNFTVKLSNDIKILHNNSEVGSLQTGISFKTGHLYKLVLKLINGTASGVIAATVYRVGESSSVGTGATLESGEYVRTFTAESGISYNVCIYFPSTNHIENAELMLTMEDLTEASNQKEKQDAQLLSLYEANNGAFRFTQGGFSRAGAKLTGNYLKWYLVSGDYIQKNVYQCTASTGYKITVHAWENEIYKGFLASENTLTTNSSTSVYWTDQVNMAQLREAYPSYDFRIELCNSLTAQGTNTSIYTDESRNVIFTESPSDGIREYYKTEMEKTINEVRDAITEPCVVFPVVTDIHFLSTSNFSDLYNVCAENMVYFCDNVPCDFILNLGDNTDGDTAQNETIRRSMHILNSLAKTYAPYLQAIGNHDTNYFGSFDRLTMKQTYSAYLSSVHNVVFTEEDGNSNYYKDVENIGVRVVVLNANYGNKYIFSPGTASWLAEKAFNTDRMILLCLHLSSVNTQNWEARSLTNGSDVTNAIQTFINNGGELIQLCGHSHADYYFSSPWLSVFSGCQKFEQVDVTTSGFLAITGYEGSIYSAPRTLKTESEDLWTVGVLMPISGILAMIRFGAGRNRYFHYAKTEVTTTVTLSSILAGNLTWTTGNASVATVSNGVVTAVASGNCQITATDTDGNFETWTIKV